MLYRNSVFYVGLGLLFVSLCLINYGCEVSSKGICVEQTNYGITSVETNGRSCAGTSDICSCNNQVSEGYCGTDEVCTSNLRIKCDKEELGTSRSCDVPEKLRGRYGYNKGTQICKDEGLRELYWGDCKTVSQSGTESALEGRSSEPTTGFEPRFELISDGGNVDSGSPEPKPPVCSAGQVRPCYPLDKPGCKPDGMDAFKCVGACKAGTEQCIDGKWSGVCEKSVVSEAESCDGKDNNCNGMIDEGVQYCVVTVAGTCGTRGGKDPHTGTVLPCSQSKLFDSPSGVAVARSGSLYVVDHNNSRICKVVNASTLEDVGTKGSYQFKLPTSMALSEANEIFIVDSRNHSIAKVNKDGVCSLVAGTGKPGTENGVGNQASFHLPFGIALSQGDFPLYITDFSNKKIRKITSDLNVSTLKDSFEGPRGIVVLSDGSLLVSEYTVSKIKRYETFSGNVTVYAGGSGKQGSKDGDWKVAEFNGPMGLAYDYNEKTLYVADFLNNSIRAVTHQRKVITVAGHTGLFGYKDGPGSSALFRNPEGVAFYDSGSHSFLFVADKNNHCIRRISIK